jgi:hypothetical protein
VEVEVTFTREELRKLAEVEYLRLFGSTPDGYELQAWDHYGGIKVQVHKQIETPAQVVQAPEPVPAISEF